VISRGKGDCMLPARLKAWSAQLCRDLQCLGDLQKTISFERKVGEILCLGSSAPSLKWAGRSELKTEQFPRFDQGCL